MKRIPAIAYAALLLALAMVGCKSQYDALLASNDVDAKYNAAFRYFNIGKYQKAAGMFESLSVYVSQTEREDTVLYYWGLSNYRNRDYYSAEANFQKYVETFPSSPFTQQAAFMRLDCLYKQTLRYELDASPSYACITAIDQYLTDYPNTEYLSDCRVMLKDLGDRLDRKAFENARLYYRMEDYKASKVAFRNILKDDADNIYREDILYYIAMSSYRYAHLSVKDKQYERYLTFIDDYLNFIGEFPDSPYRKELGAMYARAQKATGRYAGSDDDSLMEGSEKEFDKERKAAEKRIEKQDRAAREEARKAERTARIRQKAEDAARRGAEKAAKKAKGQAAREITDKAAQDAKEVSTVKKD